jgi:uncharacterized protein
MDITPLIPEGRQIIQAYGNGQFRVNGALFGEAIIVFPERTIPWPDSGLTAAAFQPVLAVAEEVELLLVGCGLRAAFVPPGVRQTLRQAGIVLDAMDTGAACRTYNVLLAEGRRIAAALMPV